MSLKKNALILALVLPALALAQLDPNSVTVTASRGANVQPDQILFSLRVDANVNTTFDTVVAALSSVGVTATNWTGINQTYDQQGRIQVAQIEWAFALAAPTSKLKDTIAALSSLQQTVAQNKSGLTLSFSVQGTVVSQQLLQAQACSISDLLNDARHQAQTMATAAGLFLGPILAMSGSTSITTGADAIRSYLGLSNVSPNCTLTVKFSLLR